MQRQIPHPPGTFALCVACKQEPRHVEARGRYLRETMHASVPAIRHGLECRCTAATGLHGTLSDAIGEWGQRNGQIALALPAPIPFHQARRRRAAQEKTHG